MLKEQNTDVFGQVPAGLQHYEPLVTTMNANVENYKQIDRLPPFTWFTWFFVVPGALIMMLSAFGLFGNRRSQHRSRWRPRPSRRRSSRCSDRRGARLGTFGPTPGGIDVVS